MEPSMNIGPIVAYGKRKGNELESLKGRSYRASLPHSCKQTVPYAMANPPPVRPWFRLASIRATPAPVPAQEPRTTLGLPAFRTASAPSSPQTKPQPQPTPDPSSQPNRFSSSSLPTSPVHKATVSTSPPTPTHVPVSSPTHSPKTIQHSPNNHNQKPTSPPPSPLALPPSQLGTQPKIPDQPEPKTVLVHRSIDRPKPRHSPTESHKNHHGKHLSESKEDSGSGLRVITIAGENRGAYMELTQSPKKQEGKYLQKKGNSNINVDGVESESSSAEDGHVNKKEKNQKATNSSSFPMSAYMNSNVQCVNNSLLYHTSCSHHDPGVRLSLSKKPFGEGFNIKEHHT
ncbi:hypothetical protein VNO78_18626 [Psophocarpus tetragonolobus]|uniref:Uncharacterized protein n=1 Tax=Psophocarpus tetragonolobus TaxID=3891 RepID=A0AAN9XM72_PSOTE